MTHIHDLAVIGGGVHGSTIALFAARGGMDVVLVERGPLCREASGVNAGTLTMQMARVALIPYAMRAHAMWASAGQWLGHDVGVVVCDGLSLAFTEAEEEMLSFRAAKRREAGAPITLVTGKEAKAIEPGLSDEVRIAGYCKVDGFANSYQTGMAYRRALLEAGVHLRENTPAQGVERTEAGFVVKTPHGAIRARRLVLAGGVWIEHMMAWMGFTLPIKTLINQLAVTERVAPAMRTVVGIANGLLSLKQYPHGTVVIGGGWQGLGSRDGGASSLIPESLIGNIRLACHAIPSLKEARLARAWTGFESETRDALPAIGPLPGIPDAWVCGCVHAGYTSGPYIGKLMADTVLGKEPELPLFRLTGSWPLLRLKRPMHEPGPAQKPHRNPCGHHCAHAP